MDYEVCEQTYRKQFGLQEHIHIDVWHVLLAQRDKRWLLPAVVSTESRGELKSWITCKPNRAENNSACHM